MSPADPRCRLQAMQLTVKLFGALREQAGSKELELELPDGSRVCDLRRVLAATYPVLEKYEERIAASVNLELAGPDQVLADGDEVALLPPVAGGSAASDGSRACTISDRALVEGEIVARVAGPEHCRVEAGARH